ncbi:MAG: hypothetical protein JWN44_6607 [Myxococcales bacterium]|nr:hypothetical protein [Myxococcales bacterium]
MARILVVDDVAMNRELLRVLLEPAGHEVIEVDSGEAALLAATATPPDLVLLDVMLPGMNGFETASKLKQRTGGFLPIIMVTSLNDPSSRLLALRVGADDFVSKPIDRWELAARCNNLLKLRSQERELAERNQQLIELQRFRDEMASLVVHDLKNPMAVVLSNLEYVLAGDDILTQDQRDAILDARSGAFRTLRLLANLLDVSKLEASRLLLQRAKINFERLIEPILGNRTRLLASRGIVLTLAMAPDEVAIDIDLMTRVIENILDNALRYTPAQGSVKIEARCTPESCELRIGNSGPPVPEAERPHIFEKYGQAEGAQRTNLGLGLYFCRLVVEAHGGKLTLDSEATLPTVFSMQLPRSPA